MNPVQKCGFCGRPRNEVKQLIAASDSGPYICDRCVKEAGKAVTSLGEATAKKGPTRLLKPREFRAVLDQYVIGQDKAKVDLSIAVYNHYKRREAAKISTLEVEISKSNILLMGPTASGKTELARTFAKALDVPFHVGDATRLTQAGYVGDDVESLLQGLIQAADGDIERAQWGILFIDEIDKLARKSGRGATGYRDVTGEGVQQSLLKLLEGSKVPVPRGFGRIMGALDVIDTTNILFIGAGSFAGIEDIVERRLKKNSSKMGFGASLKSEHSKSDVYTNVTEDDVLDFGLIPEIVGRLPIQTTTLELSEGDLVRVLTEPKNALVKQFQALFEMDSIDLQFDPDALLFIAAEAKKRPTGARALRSILEAILKPYSYDAPDMVGLKAIRITADCAKGIAPAVMIHENVATA